MHSTLISTVVAYKQQLHSLTFMSGNVTYLHINLLCKNMLLREKVRFKSNPLVQMEPLVISYTLLLQGFTRSWKDFDWPWIKTNQRFSVSRTLDFGEKDVGQKKFGPLVVTVIRILTFACDA